MNREQAKAFCEQHKIRYVLAQFVDIHGSAKAKAVPVEHLDMVLTDGAGFAGFALWGFGMGPEGPDYMAVGDLATLQNIPWMPGYARLICNGVVNKRPYAYCSRVALQTQIARL
ncbi:MAG: type III glutamate--ammonia ligase, partial [Pseudomonadota bacterium]|nr:type III glutamate--ammonia ligase [Pseudomonadota bacterium]